MNREAFVKRRQLAATPEVQPPTGRSGFRITRRGCAIALAPGEERKSGVDNHDQPPPLGSVEADGSIKRGLSASNVA
jgi:hypothetical protein